MKNAENDRGTSYTNRDNNVYQTYLVRLLDNGGQVGLIYVFIDVGEYRPVSAGGFDMQYHLLSPYFIATIGNVYLEAEVAHYFGTYMDFDDPGVNDIDRDGWSAYINAKYNLSSGYVGAQIAWVQGEAPPK